MSLSPRLAATSHSLRMPFGGSYTSTCMRPKAFHEMRRVPLPATNAAGERAKHLPMGVCGGQEGAVGRGAGRRRPCNAAQAGIVLEQVAVRRVAQHLKLVLQVVRRALSHIWVP